MASLLVTQMLAFRAFGPIPNATFDALVSPGRPSWFVFAPYGDNTNFAQIFAAFIEPQSRVILLGEYGVLLIWVFVLSCYGGLFEVRKAA